MGLQPEFAKVLVTDFPQFTAHVLFILVFNLDFTPITRERHYKLPYLIYVELKRTGNKLHLLPYNVIFLTFLPLVFTTHRVLSLISILT